MTEKPEGIALGTVIAGRYRVVERLGEGGMGSVYQVEHVHTGQHLALKVLNAKMVQDAVALERFRRESRAPARIQSDHVVQVTDADVAAEIGGAPFLVMELLRGKSFDVLLSERGRLPPEEALAYLGQTARALDKAHGLGIVHRDIKPENLFLTRREDGTPWVKLLDFGIAKLTQDPTGSSTASKTATGAIFGTPLYMAPEQILGQTDRISAQTDVWALGVLAHKVLTGSEPWTAQTLPHLVAQIAYEALPTPSQRGSTFGPAFDAWFARCCAREPGERFASASEAVKQLADALGMEQSAVATVSNDWSSSAAGSKPLSATSDALAETAVAGSIGSDTLAAQVAPRKTSGRVVVAALIGTLVVVAGGIWLLVRGAGAQGEPPVGQAAPALTEVATAAPSVSKPTVEPAIEPMTTPATPPSASTVPTAPAAAPGKPAGGKGNGAKPPPSGAATKPPTKPDEDALMDKGRK